MQNDVLQNWKHLRGEVNSRWVHFSADDLDGVDGRRHELVHLLERHFGWTRSRAEREVDLLVNAFESRLERVS